MQQRNSDPASLTVFRAVCTGLFCGLLGLLMGVVYGPLNIPLAFALGVGGSILFRAVAEKQINYAYWWLRVLFEVRIKDDDTR